MQSVCTLSVPSQYLSVLIRSRVQGPCVTSKSTVSASALGLAIYAAAHALLEENLSPPRLASTRLPSCAHRQCSNWHGRTPHGTGHLALAH